MYTTVADLEIFRGGFSFTKTPAKLEVKTKKKKGLYQVFGLSFLAAVSLPSSPVDLGLNRKKFEQRPIWYH